MDLAIHVTYTYELPNLTRSSGVSTYSQFEQIEKKYTQLFKNYTDAYVFSLGLHEYDFINPLFCYNHIDINLFVLTKWQDLHRACKLVSESFPPQLCSMI